MFTEDSSTRMHSLLKSLSDVPAVASGFCFKEYAKLNLGSMKVNLRHFISEYLLLWIIKFESQRTYCPKPKAGSN